MKKIYIVLPTYNDWKSLEKVLEILNLRLKNLKKDIYILIINDCSKEKFKKTKNFKNFKKIIVLNLKKNLGSQKAIYVGLKYLQKKIKDYNNAIISILDSDGEDDPKALKKLIQITERKKDFFIFASRKGRTENRFLKILNKARLYITLILTGKFINFGNFSSFPSSLLKRITLNDDIFLAFSSGVAKNYSKLFLYNVKKNKRFYDTSKVNIKFLIIHSIKIISVFYKIVFLRTFLIMSFLLLISKNNFYSSYIIIFTFLLINILLFLISWFGKPKKEVSNFIKNISSIKIAS
tara:strand:+ start:677 stop:1555 length:879 start_codon:yes stop_codon:yes gene_type:complete